MAAILSLGFLSAEPAAGQAKLFTVDFDGDDLNDLDGSDDLPFSFTGSQGLVSGEIRAVDVSVNPAALQATVETYVDFTGGIPLNFAVMDVLIFDVVLFAGSAPIDEIGVSVGTSPIVLDPVGAGYFLGCVTGLEIGCRSAVTTPVGGETTFPAAPGAAISLSPGTPFPPFPGAALFGFDKLNLATDNLESGETSRRLFVTWPDLGPPGPLSEVDQWAVFMISSGTNQDFFVEIVEEPATPLAASTSGLRYHRAASPFALALGLAGLGLVGSRRSRRLRRAFLLGLAAALGLALGAAPPASAAPDISRVSIINEDDGFPGVCTAPCFAVEKQVEVFLDGNLTGPGVCPAGNNTYLYRLTHLGGTLPFPNIPVTEFEVQVDFTLLTSAGFIPFGGGIGPTATTISPLDIVSWQFPLSTACPACLDQGKTSEQLFICSAAPPGTVPVSLTGVGLDVPFGDCLGPVSEPPVAPVSVDIKPGSCPNSYNRNNKGVLPLAVVGTADFDVTQIDVGTLQLSRADGVGGSVSPLNGPPGPGSEFEDVATPFEGELCGCHEEEGDGILDLSLKFKTEDLVPALGLDALMNGALPELVVSGNLMDGTPFEGSDCVRLVPPGTSSSHLTLGGNMNGAWIDASPLDDTLDGGGFVSFERSYPQTTEVTLTASAWHNGRGFKGWQVNGGALVREPALALVIDEPVAVEAVYRSGGCGLGMELVLLLVPMMWLHRRRRSRCS